MTRRERKKRYEGVLGTVEHNTGGPTDPNPQPPAMRECYILSNRKRANYDPDAIRRTLQAAVENGDLFRFEDREGHTRYARTTDAALQQVAAWAADQCPPDQALVAHVNRLRREQR